MANYIDTLTGAYPVSEQTIRQQHANTSFTNPFVPPEGYAVIFPSPTPEYDPITQAVREIEPVFTSKGHYEQQWEVIDLDAETISANQAAQTEQAAKTEQSRIESLWKAADAYTSGYISGVAIGLLTIGVLQQKPKALAVSAWSSQVWGEYYVRKGNGSTDTDFTSFGPMPYSVPELQAELGM